MAAQLIFDEFLATSRRGRGGDDSLLVPLAGISTAEVLATLSMILKTSSMGLRRSSRLPSACTEVLAMSWALEALAITAWIYD
jgi:hypothetical protein